MNQSIHDHEPWHDRHHVNKCNQQSHSHLIHNSHQNREQWCHSQVNPKPYSYLAWPMTKTIAICERCMQHSKRSSGFRKLTASLQATKFAHYPTYCKFPKTSWFWQVKVKYKVFLIVCRKEDPHRLIMWSHGMSRYQRYTEYQALSTDELILSLANS